MFSLLYTIFPILFVIGIVYLLVRARQNRPTEITAQQALTGYFYIVAAAGVIMTTVGLVYFMKVAISRAYTSDGIEQEIILAVVMSIVGIILYASHIYGRKAYEKAKGQPSINARKAYHILMLALSSLTGLIALPWAIYSTISHHYEIPSIYERYLSNPSTELALAVVVIPIWAYYLCMVIKEAKINGGEEQQD